METNVSVERALQLLLERVFSAGKPDTSEEVSLLAALGRVACDTITAVMDQPPFHRSPLDGFAAHHSDLTEAGRDTPVTLRINQTLHAGDYPQAPLAPGEAARVMTGAPLPEGATCVMRQEDTKTDGESVTMYVSLREHQNFCFQGEDLKKDTLVITGGSRFDAAHIGVLAGQGFEVVRVCRRPRISVISTGSELSQPGSPLQPGKIYDSNRLLLTARSVEMGADIVHDTSVMDDPAQIAAALLKALPEADMLITTGGVSVGDKDYMRSVGEQIGGEMVFSGFQAKPGGPAFAMMKEGKLILCLSGNPFAACASFELLAVPVIRQLAGEKDLRHRRVQGRMSSVFAKASGGRRFLRAKIEGSSISIPETGHDSGMLSTLAGCNCLLDIPAGNRGLQVGDEMEVVMFERVYSF